jgi:hypothetical protein
MGSRLVSVTMAAPYADHHYAFRTTCKEATSTALGHVAVTASTPVQGLIFKANAPKPKRASKVLATGTESSFVAPASIAAAVAAGWNVVKAKPNGRKAPSRFQVPVYVTINGVKYAWGMRRTQVAKLGSNLAAIGIKIATGAEVDLVFGASFPKPPRCLSLLTSGKGAEANTTSSSTFYDPSNESSVIGKFATYAGENTQSDWADFV